MKPFQVGLLVVFTVLGLSVVGWLGGAQLASTDLAILTNSVATRALVTLILLAGALFVILSGKYGSSEKHWAYGVAGTIVGFYLKG